MITQCVKRHHDTDHNGQIAVETSIVYLADKLSLLDLSNINEKEEEDDVVADILSTIPNWEKSKCTSEQITIACRLADEQWLEVMESFGMVDLDIDEDLEENYLFQTDLERL